MKLSYKFNGKLVINEKSKNVYIIDGSKSQKRYVKHNKQFMTIAEYKKSLSGKKIIMSGGHGIINEQIIKEVLSIKKKLNYYYIDTFCDKDVKEIIDLYNKTIWKGNIQNICFITTAALVWLLSGEDKVTPFLGKWDTVASVTTDYKQYEHCAVALVTDEEEAESTLEHAFISLNYGNIILDSNWSTNQCIVQTTSTDNNLKQNNDYVMKYITLDISIEDEIYKRIELVKKYRH